MTEDAGRLNEGELVEQRWEVQHLLGMGELAEVYEVADRWTGGNAVLKLFAPQYLMAPAAWAGYQEYCERVRALSLPALVNPFAFGIHPASAAPFSVAERVGLPALDQLVATVGTLLPAQFARILRERPDDLVLPRAEPPHVDGRRVEGDAALGGRGRLVDERRLVEERLRRDAAAEQADTARLGLRVHERDVEPQIGRAERGGVAARSRAEHDDAGVDRVRTGHWPSRSRRKGSSSASHTQRRKRAASAPSMMRWS